MPRHCGAAPSVAGQAWSMIRSVGTPRSGAPRSCKLDKMDSGLVNNVAAVVDLYAGRSCSIFRTGHAFYGGIRRIAQWACHACTLIVIT